MIDPATGHTLATTRVLAGRQTLVVPPLNDGRRADDLVVIRPLARLRLNPQLEGGVMSEWVRVATFEGDEAAAQAIVDEINKESGPPPGIPSKSIMVGLDRENNHVRIVVRFDSKENLDIGSATLDGMEPPPESGMRRISVEKLEILLERHA